MFRILPLLCLFVSVSAQAKTGSSRFLAIDGGVGAWSSDSFRASWHYGGEILIYPGVQFLELNVSYDRQKVNIPSHDPLFSTFAGKWVGVGMVGLGVPYRLTIFGAPGNLYTTGGYVLTHFESRHTNGWFINGGMEVLFGSSRFGLRIELRSLFYRIPYSGGETPLQQDTYVVLKFLMVLI